MEAENRFWKLKLAEATLHWTERHDAGGLPDAQFDAIMAELAGIKRMLRTLACARPEGHPQAAAG